MVARKTAGGKLIKTAIDIRHTLKEQKRVAKLFEDFAANQIS
jgi:hypothetical protein